MKKKGLEIGVNAIVVLVFAVTVLGLGLAFIKGAFNQLTGDFAAVSDAVKDQIREEVESTNSLLAFNAVDLNVKRSKSTNAYFGVKNELDQELTFKIEGGGVLASDGSWVTKESVISCFDAIDASARATASRDVTFDTFENIRIAKGDVAFSKLIIKVSSAAKPTTYSCAMVIKNPKAVAEELYARKDFFITVT